MSTLQINNVKVFLTGKEEGIVGNASINILGLLVINGLKVIKSAGRGYMVAMPSQAYQKDGQTQYKDVAYCLENSARNAITRSVMEEFFKQQQQQQQG
jgi:DNA-binding cell septation regulator SpoVG